MREPHGKETCQEMDNQSHRMDTPWTQMTSRPTTNETVCDLIQYVGPTLSRIAKNTKLWKACKK